ncbi:SRPBCC domain-containing protein [Paenibacillus sp. LMG 31456]|uniref:SRPBCC domain-containing protein n=1 Tax=Paenibacillus foliorum TaxID=2654974 RepID=A0A972H6W4_9BACL|nr:SRPBCC domain-containing protein [Paenibacillus foliorum]NOU97486.1 SRPBCC domain-containing protein [Paenibacillus foliorum]
MKQDLSLDFQFKSSIKQVWNALTDSDKLAKWVMDNDFKPIVGHRFQFRREPVAGWDGIIHCEVLEVVEPHRLSYTWDSGGENTTIIWTLQENEDGNVHLHLDQIGFSKVQALGGAKYGWTSMCGQLEKVLVEL